ncbi:lipid-A-disaccharide synthase [Candidatus Endowatersipora endosymbiont of Watersipora subatra]|uniref:lipid-A-disaccharide synthase n=1 Tax=Candidatus Endowatersipora endosymbiont of Watersipora subatra TaxID=3077946 RepID=UPI00312C80A4
MPYNYKPMIYFLIGEESGDALGKDLYNSLQRCAKRQRIELDIQGLAGTSLSELGVKSLFNIEDIMVMGIFSVVARLPTIIKCILMTVSDIVKKKPDLIVLIDSPDFTHAVAKRVRKKLPQIQVINYVCPSIWAWRSGRARKMREFVDHVLAILPFEPKIIEELGGPKSTYVGHSMVTKIDKVRLTQVKALNNEKPILLLLPGSRSTELKHLLIIFEKTLDILTKRGVPFQAIMPAVPHLKKRLCKKISQWATPVRIVDSSQNDHTFAKADAALATSGTVSLQLALHRIPMILVYKLDILARPLRFLIKTWSVALPNLIAGWPLIPEELNEMLDPERLARHIERLLIATPERDAQLAGFDYIRDIMKTEIEPAEKSAAIIMSYLVEKKQDNRLDSCRSLLS